MQHRIQSSYEIVNVEALERVLVIMYVLIIQASEVFFNIVLEVYLEASPRAFLVPQIAPQMLRKVVQNNKQREGCNTP